jgi:hypothetical protein
VLKAEGVRELELHKDTQVLCVGGGHLLHVTVGDSEELEDPLEDLDTDTLRDAEKVTGKVADVDGATEAVRVTETLRETDVDALRLLEGLGGGSTEVDCEGDRERLGLAEDVAREELLGEDEGQWLTVRVRVGVGLTERDRVPVGHDVEDLDTDIDLERVTRLLPVTEEEREAETDADAEELPDMLPVSD